jgi:insulysin
VIVPRLDQPLHPFQGDDVLGQYLKFVPVKDKDLLTVFWPGLPYSQERYLSQPLKYFSHLFGHEGPHSLLSHLKREGLALELSAYLEHEIWSISTFFVDITLTKRGLAEVERVLAAVARYAQVVRDAGVQEYIFEEYRRVGEIEFQFADKEEPLEYCVKLAGKMQLFDEDVKLKDLLRHEHVV